MFGIGIQKSLFRAKNSLLPWARAGSREVEVHTSSSKLRMPLVIYQVTLQKALVKIHLVEDYVGLVQGTLKFGNTALDFLVLSHLAIPAAS